jgi:hypothetical protein
LIVVKCHLSNFSAISWDYFEKGFVYIVGVKQQPHDHSILASWNSVHLYKDGYDMINKVREIQAIGGYNTSIKIKGWKIKSCGNFKLLIYAYLLAFLQLLIPGNQGCIPL